MHAAELRVQLDKIARSCRIDPMKSTDCKKIWIIGTYHNVSKKYLHRYLWQFDFVWNSRKLNEGERTVLAIKAAEGKRLMYQSAPNHV